MLRSDGEEEGVSVCPRVRGWGTFMSGCGRRAGAAERDIKILTNERSQMIAKDVASPCGYTCNKQKISAYTKEAKPHISEYMLSPLAYWLTPILWNVFPS